MKNLLYPLLALALFSCGGSSSSASTNQLTANDFESVNGWTSGVVNPSLTKEKAHSGAYSVKVDPAIEFSLGYDNQLGKLSATRLRAIKLHCWVFLPNDKAAVMLVTDIQKPGEAKSLQWDGFDLLKEAKSKSSLNKWLEVEHVVAVPEAANYLSRIVVYLWRGGSTQPVYLDDLQISKAE